VFIADKQGRPLASQKLLDEAAISVVTLAELELGVHLAALERARGQRLRTLRAIQSTHVALPIDEAIASSFAELVATAQRAGKRPKIQDAWIAATARAADVPVYTEDNNFDDLAVDVVRF
jgi:predicted nucleic acid-binding protein